MKENIRTLMKGKLIPAILSIVLGIVLIIARRAALDVLVKIVGILIAVSGLAFIIAYFVRGNSDSGKLQLIVGPAVIAIIFGIVLFFCASAVVDFFPILMGIILILNGLSHLTMASVDDGDRVLTAIMGVIVIIFGVLIVLRPGFVADAVMVFIGAFFIVNGLFDLFIVKRFNDSNLVE